MNLQADISQLDGQKNMGTIKMDWKRRYCEIPNIVDEFTNLCYNTELENIRSELMDAIDDYNRNLTQEDEDEQDGI